MSTTINLTTSTNLIDYIVDVPCIHSLNKSNIYICIQDAIIQKLQSIPELHKLRLNPELTFFVCNIIKNYFCNAK